MRISRLILGLSLLSAPVFAKDSKSKPREIIIESSTPSTDDSSEKPAQYSDEEQRARDNALLAGAVDIDQTLHAGGESRKVDQDFSVRSGKCYSVSVAWKSPYRATIEYTLGRGSDGRPVNEFLSSDTATTFLREGVVQFCADRSGPIHFGIMAEDGTPDTPRDYVIVVGSRPETSAQREARHRRGTAQRAAASAAPTPNRRPSR